MKKVDEASEEQSKIRQRKRLILLSIVIGVLLLSAFGWWQKTVPAEMTPLPAPVSSEYVRKPAREYVVYVSGRVKHPGVLKVPAGARVIDAVDAAGGLTEGADAAKVNLAQAVKDGMQINVPGSQPGPAPSGNAAKSDGQGKNRGHQGTHADRTENVKVNINTAEEAELDKLPGIGAALAARIVEWRRTNGPFRDGADIKKIPGVGEAKYQLFKERITW